MKVVKDILGAILVWVDMSMVMLTALISIASGLFGMKSWSTAQYLWSSLSFPYDRWAEWSVVSEWATTAFYNGSLVTAGWAWLYTCATGFLTTVCLLSAHEAFCRLRVRLG